MSHATGTGAGKKYYRSMGHYSLLSYKVNNFPAWKLDSKGVLSYLYRSKEGKWYISRALDDKKKRIVSHKNSSTPFDTDLKWMYRSKETKKWVVDEDLTVFGTKGK